MNPLFTHHPLTKQELFKDINLNRGRKQDGNEEKINSKGLWQCYNLLLNLWSISEGETLFNLQEGMGRFSLAKLKTRP